MLLSELIQELQTLQAASGDLEVEVRNASGDFAPVEELTEHEDRWGVVVRIDS